VGLIAGSMVTEGKVSRSDLVEVMRDGQIVWEGKIAALKRFKDDVKEVAEGFECGIELEGFQDIKEGDQLEVYRLERTN
jgi:translation initiation factor IF-2